MHTDDTPTTVYIVFQNHRGDHTIMGVFSTRKAATAKAKQLRADDEYKTCTYPVISYRVEDLPTAT